MRTLGRRTAPGSGPPLRRTRWTGATAAVAGVVAAAMAAGCAAGASDNVATTPTTAGPPRTPPTLLNARPEPPASVTSSTATTDAPTTTTTTPETTTTAPAAAARGSQGCGTSSSGFVDVEGRRALVRSPGPARPAPAVIVLHGYTGKPEHIEATSGWTPFLQGKGAIAVYPEGTPVTGEVGFGWSSDSGRFATRGVDDVGFLRHLVDTLVAEHCVDRSSIILTGESNGGGMVVKAGCDARLVGTFALVAPVIPAVSSGTLAGCHGAPFPLLAIASKKDRTVTYDGRYAPGTAPLMAQEQWISVFGGQQNGCSDAKPGRQAIDGAERITPAGCQAPTDLIAVTDGVHTWPGGPTGTGDLSPGRFPATQTIWSAARVER